MALSLPVYLASNLIYKQPGICFAQDTQTCSTQITTCSKYFEAKIKRWMNDQPASGPADGMESLSEVEYMEKRHNPAY